MPVSTRATSVAETITAAGGEPHVVRSRPRCRRDRGSACGSAGSPDAMTSAAAATAAASNSAHPSVPRTWPPTTIDIDGADLARGRAVHPHRLRLDGRSVAGRARADRGAAHRAALRVPSGAPRSPRARSCTACGTTDMMASSPSRTPEGDPGRFTTSALPIVPATALESAAMGVCVTSFGPHQLGETRRLAVDHGAGRFRRHVARAESGAAGGHDQGVRRRELAQEGLDLAPLVGHDRRATRRRSRTPAGSRPPRRPTHRRASRRRRRRTPSPPRRALRVACAPSSHLARPSDLGLARSAGVGVRWLPCPTSRRPRHRPTAR